jgi:hypothetical protein
VCRLTSVVQPCSKAQERSSVSTYKHVDLQACRLHTSVSTTSVSTYKRVDFKRGAALQQGSRKVKRVDYKRVDLQACQLASMSTTSAVQPFAARLKKGQACRQA